MSTAKHPQPSSIPNPDSKKRGPVARAIRLITQAEAENAARDAPAPSPPPPPPAAP